MSCGFPLSPFHNFVIYREKLKVFSDRKAAHLCKQSNSSYYGLLNRDVMPIHTLAQVISGGGTPMARQGRVMGVPSIVLNT